MAIMSRITRRVRTDGLHVDSVRSIVDELFLTRPMESRDRIVRDSNGDDGERDYRITEEDLLDACSKINPNKAVGVDGITETAFKVEKRMDKVLRVLNTVNNIRKIPAKWEVARYSFRNRVETPHFHED